LSTIRDSDLILVIADGQLRESGTHEELMTREGLYHQLYVKGNQ
jgi:ABC-type multidrug transport system fused ATPase/permease subunit